MEKLTLTIPTLFGDHHTIAVRTILEEMDGVTEVYVSPAFRQVAITYDPKKVEAAAIEKVLAEKGYSADAPELEYALNPSVKVNRHSAAVASAGDSLVFHENPPAYEGRPLWPCPGFEPLPDMEME
jgi:copper chaperone CopZ